MAATQTDFSRSSEMDESHQEEFIEDKESGAETKLFQNITETGPVFCEPCFKEGKPAFAVKLCLSCSGKLCETCKEKHSCDRATNAKVDEHRELIMAGINCDPCKKRGVLIECIKICEECEESFCKQCEDFHLSLKATRSHNLMEIPVESIRCSVCIKQNGNDKEAEKRCDFCNINLCVACTKAHTSDTPKQHKLVDIPLHKERKATKINSLKQYIKQQKEKQETKMRAPTKDRTDKPGKPKALITFIESVSLTWENPKQMFDDHSFQIRYKIVHESEKGSNRWKIYGKQTADNHIRLSGLKPETQYVFQVRMVENEEEGCYSEPSNIVKTKKSAASELFNFTKQTSHSDTSPVIRQIVPMQNDVYRNKKARTKKLIFQGNIEPRTEKTIMLVGATGSGKSTLIDGIINYIYGVTWEDPFRFTLIDLEEEEKNNLQNQAVSQTEWVTCYSIQPMNGGRLDYTLNIVDTPGFGDTRGIERDREIINQIRELFSGKGKVGTTFLDAVCFLTKAPDARLTASQTYIFESILSLFGKNIEDNICILITFADGKRPPVLSALAKANLPYELYFTFNNSGLFAENKDTERSSMSAMFWELGVNSFELFFEHLGILSPKSLALTNQVLKERQTIEATIENLEPLIQTGLSKIEVLKQETKIFKDHKSDIDENKNFEYEVPETKMIPYPLEKGTYVTNCMNCNTTCHRHCGIRDDADKKGCWAMDSSGNCHQCEGECHWQHHRNTPFYYEPVETVVKKTYKEMLNKYNKAKSAILSHSELIKAMTKDLQELEITVITLINQLNECNNRLKEIALRPNPLDTKGYIDMMIQSEEIEKKPGFLNRIKTLERYKRRLNVAGDAEKLINQIAEKNQKKGFMDQAKALIKGFF